MHKHMLVEKTIYICDKCNEMKGLISICVICEKEICYQCLQDEVKKGEGIQIKDGYGSYSDEFYICQHCLDNKNNMENLKKLEILTILLKFQELKEELNQINREYEKNFKLFEDKIKKLKEKGLSQYPKNYRNHKDKILYVIKDGTKRNN